MDDELREYLREMITIMRHIQDKLDRISITNSIDDVYSNLSDIDDKLLGITSTLGDIDRHTRT